MKSPNKDVFEEVMRAVVNLMKSDSYPRFRRDPLFTRLTKRLKKRDFVNYRSNIGLRQRIQTTLDGAKKDNEILTERDWMLLLSGAESVVYNRDDVILKKGDKPRYFYKIKTGKAIVECESFQQIHGSHFIEGL